MRCQENARFVLCTKRKDIEYHTDFCFHYDSLILFSMYMMLLLSWLVWMRDCNYWSPCKWIRHCCCFRDQKEMAFHPWILPLKYSYMNQVSLCFLSSTSSFDFETKSWSASQSNRVNVRFQFFFCESGIDWSETLSPTLMFGIECKSVCHVFFLLQADVAGGGEKRKG